MLAPWVSWNTVYVYNPVTVLTCYCPKLSTAANIAVMVCLSTQSVIHFLPLFTARWCFCLRCQQIGVSTCCSRKSQSPTYFPAVQNSPAKYKQGFTRCKWKFSLLILQFQVNIQPNYHLRPRKDSIESFSSSQVNRDIIGPLALLKSPLHLNNSNYMAQTDVILIKCANCVSKWRIFIGSYYCRTVPVGQVCGCDSPWTGGLILLALLHSSPTICFHAMLGSAAGMPSG